jgi:hypothetical protein
MHDRLRQSPIGLSEEIRRRVNRTFIEDQFDAQTRELADDIMELARLVQVQIASTPGSQPPWHANPGAYQALTVAMATWMKINEPKWAGGAADDLAGPLEPNTWGVTLATTYRQVKEYREKTFQELRQRYPEPTKEEEGGRS